MSTESRIHPAGLLTTLGGSSADKSSSRCVRWNVGWGQPVSRQLSMETKWFEPSDRGKLICGGLVAPSNQLCVQWLVGMCFISRKFRFCWRRAQFQSLLQSRGYRHSTEWGLVVGQCWAQVRHRPKPKFTLEQNQQCQSGSCGVMVWSEDLKSALLGNTPSPACISCMNCVIFFLTDNT